MTPMESAGVLGVSLVDDQLRIVEGRKHLNDFQIAQIAHGRVRQPFSFDSLTDRSMTRRFAEDISRLYNSHEFQVKEAAFSLDSRMVLIKKMPVDKHLELSRVEEHINWEVRQFTISPISEYIVDFEESNSNHQNGELDHVIVVIVRKKIVEFLRQIFKHTDLTLKVVDVDIFSAHRALQLNYDYNKTGRIGLVDIAESKVSFSIIEDKNYYLSQEFAIPNSNTNIEKRYDSTTHLISKELRRIMLDHQLGRGVEDLSEIYLYGEAVEDGILEGLQNNYNVRIDRANPFRRVKLPNKLKDEFGASRPERFMVAVGAAIRGVQ